VQWRSLSVVSLILVKVVIRIVFHECDESAFIHFVLLKKIAKHHQGLKDLCSFSRFPGYILWLWRLSINEPLKRELLKIRQLQEGARKGRKSVVLNAKSLQLLTSPNFFWYFRNHIGCHIQLLQFNQFADLGRQIRNFILLECQLFEHLDIKQLLR
jgi:hypothetical protein